MTSRNNTVDALTSKSKGKGMILYSAVSSLLDRSKRFTLFLPHHQLGFSGKHSSHTAITRNDYSLTHTCQPSRIRRDSPAFSSDVPPPAKCDRCPAFLENGIIIFFVADYAPCLPRNATK